MRLEALANASGLPKAERIRVIVVILLSALVALVFFVSLVAMTGMRLSDPEADVSGWLGAFLVCLGYLAGILVGIIAVPCGRPGAQGGAAQAPPAGRLPL